MRQALVFSLGKSVASRRASRFSLALSFLALALISPACALVAVLLSLGARCRTTRCGAIFAAAYGYRIPV